MPPKHVIIIGGGVIGLSVAAECVRRSHRVTVIEGAPGQRGASFGNAGMIVPSHFIPLAAPGMVALGLKWMWNPESPFYIEPRLDWDLIAWAWRFWRSATRDHVERAAPLLRDLHFASRELFVQLASEHDFGLVQKGLLMLCKTQHTMDEEAITARRATELGVTAEVLSAEQTAALDPQITMDVAGSVYFPRDCHLDPRRYITVLEAQLRAAQATILEGVHVQGLRKEGRAISAAITDQGEIAGDEFVLCGGAWSSELAMNFGLKLPMQAGRGYSITVADPVELPQLCSILAEARVAVTPMGSSLRFGGTMEITSKDSPPRPRRVQGILKSLPAYFPKFARQQFDAETAWSGLRPCSPDGLPYLGRTQAAANLTLATAHAMMGLSLAPVTGAIVGGVLDEEPPAFDLRLMSPDRFA